MRNLTVTLGMALLAFTARAALPQPDLIAQIHFAGAQKISADPHSRAFTNEFCSTEALALRQQTANKLSAWLAGWLHTNLNVTVPEGAAKLRPLFDDLQESEFFAEARATANGKVAVAVAIKLDAARAQLWQAGLKPFFPAAGFKSSGNWLIFDSGTAPPALADHLAQKLATPPAGWLDLDINWPRLAQWYPKLKELGLPESQFTVTAPDENFRINGKLLYPENLSLNLEPWQVPTNTVHVPFDSFSAVRGFAAWFHRQPWAQEYQLTPIPNQLFVWSLPHAPFETFAAIPVPDASAALVQTYEKLVPVFNQADAQGVFFHALTPTLTNKLLTFVGVPFAAPQMRAIKEPAGQFLLGGLFPNPGRPQPLPPELFKRLETPNLVYYHWEITAARIPELLQVTQLGLMITQHKQLDAQAQAYKWMQRVGSTMANTDTEITQSGPAEMTFARKTPGLFTATEMFELANWLEATNFPGCDLKLPPRHPRFPSLPAGK